MLRILLITLCCFCFAANSETLAITNAHIFSMGAAGELKTGTVVVAQGKIVSVSAGAKIPSGARVIDAKGNIVTPGFVMTGTGLGADEIPGVPSTIQSGVTSSNLSAGFDIQYSINPDSTLLPIARLVGSTSVVVTPRFNRQPNVAPVVDRLFAGQAALISLKAADHIVLRPKIAMALPAGSAGAANAGGPRGAFFIRLKKQLDEARVYRGNRAAYNQNRLRKLSLEAEDLEALIPVVEGRLPPLVDVDRASDIRQMLAFARKEKIRLILAGATEGWRVADEIAAAHTPVLLDSMENLPSSFDSLAATLENAARLSAGKVSISILSPSFLTDVKAARLSAGTAVSRGLPWIEGLAALTINPARAFGVADMVGSLAPGKNADLVIWNGDPLETSGHVELMLIKGEEQPLVSRQTLLRDRYMAPSNGYPAQYR